MPDTFDKYAHLRPEHPPIIYAFLIQDGQDILKLDIQQGQLKSE